MHDNASRAFSVQIGARTYRVNLDDCHDLSIPLLFDGPQPAFFGAAAASGEVLKAGGFTGDVRQGGTCNCSTYSLTPHCNGTHTECVGHITSDRISVRDIAREVLVPAHLLSVMPAPMNLTRERSLPAPRSGDTLITRESLEIAAQPHDMAGTRALVIRTLPNTPDKQRRDYGAGHPPAYFSREAMEWIVAHDIDHLVVDLPSLDRANDEGQLTAHRVFWGMPAVVTKALHATRAHATVTELAYIDDGIVDGRYLLNLQVAPFTADAAPSRPFLMNLIEQ